MSTGVHLNGCSNVTTPPREPGVTRVRYVPVSRWLLSEIEPGGDDTKLLIGKNYTPTVSLFASWGIDVFSSAAQCTSAA